MPGSVGNQKEGAKETKEEVKDFPAKEQKGEAREVGIPMEEAKEIGALKEEARVTKEFVGHATR